MAEIERRIYSFLNENVIDYQIFEHKPVTTCEKMAKFLKTDQNLIAKSMLLRKNDGKYILAVLPGNMRIDYNKLARISKTKSLSLAPAEEVENIVGCSVGCVHPIGNLINLETYFDRKILKNKEIFFNPGSHKKSIKIDTDDLIKLIEPTIVDLIKSSNR